MSSCPVSADARGRILFVDDELGIRRSYKRFFDRDHEVVLADGGRQALALLSERQDFDCVVCDLIMPDLNGMELYAEVLKSYPELARRFIFVTGCANQGDIEAFLRRVAQPVLEKPFDFDALSALLASRLG
jgi:two-component system, NtrC family, sensor kinase